MRLTWRIALMLGLVGTGASEWVPGLGNIAFVRQVHAEETSPQATTLEEYCRTWASNGMLGVKVHLRNGIRKITYIDENELRYLLKHQAAGDNLYLLKGEYTPAQKRYLEESLLAGYDRSAQWLGSHGGQSPDITSWESEAFTACMSTVPGAIQALLDGQ